MEKGKHQDLLLLDTLNGEFYTRPTKKFLKREKWERPDPNEVRSFIPGMVVCLVAQEGQELPAGAPLVIFEAMKMQSTLTMPFAGTVRKIHVKVGDVVAKNVLLMDIDGA